MRNQLKAPITALVSLVLVAGAFGSPAHADDYPSLSAQDEAFVRAQAEHFGVSVEVQDTLLAKLDAGIPLDSQIGSSPVSVVTTTVDGKTRTVETYADGSIIGTEMDLPKDVSEGAAARGIVGCTTGSSAGVYYGTNCWIYKTSLTIGASFYTDYSRWAGGASVSNWHDPYVEIVGSSATSRAFYLVNGGSSIQLYWNITIGGIVTGNSWLQFNASPSGISESSGGVW